MKNTHKAMFFLSTLLFISLLSCTNRTNDNNDKHADTLKLKYSKLLKIVKYDDYTTVTINNPWNKDKILHTYVLVPSNKKLSKKLPNGILLRTPIKKTIIFPTVLCKLLETLNKKECLIGVADKEYITIDYVQQGIKNKKIIDCGISTNPILENIINANADALFLSAFENNAVIPKLQNIGVPIIECADYMEETPLARAEWIRLYGILYGCQQKADSLFNVIDSSYNVLKNKALKLNTSVKVMTDKLYCGTWYVPGGNGYTSIMLKDAGANYIFNYLNKAGSIPLSFETVLDKAINSDVWLIKYNSTKDYIKQDLLAENSGYDQFKPYKTGNIYGCNTFIVPFFEETPFRPDWLLNDLIIIFHPNNKEFGDLKYYKKLK